MKHPNHFLLEVNQIGSSVKLCIWCSLLSNCLAVLQQEVHISSKKFQIVVLIKQRLYSTWWKYSVSWKFSLHFVCIFRTVWNFSIRSWNFNASFKSNIETPLNSKFGKPAYAQIAITSYYILFGTKYSRMDPVKFVEGSL